MSISNESIYKRLRAKLAIDPMMIDQELIEMPQLVQEAVECATESMQTRDSAKNMLDYAQATAADRLRSVLVVDAGSKNTEPKKRSEAQIASEVPLQDAVQSALFDLEQAKYDFALWDGLVDSLREKSGSLKRLSELIMAGYLTPSSAQSDRRAEIQRKRINMEKSQ